MTDSMKIRITFLLLIFALQSCNKTPMEKKARNIETSDSELEGCYAFIQNNDSILMDLKLNGNEVTGSLRYNFYEKDDNEGSLLGEVHGDTIFAVYKFDSEGKTSSREVAFLNRGNEYVEGFGEIEEKNGKMVFKNKKALNFNSNLILQKTDCK